MWSILEEGQNQQFLTEMQKICVFLIVSFSNCTIDNLMPFETEH